MQELEVTTRDSDAELTALGKAKAILLKHFAAFVQTKAVARDDTESVA